jgi:hypothetical protein
MNILFHENFLNKRGTSVALFDYAYYNQIILGNKSYIISNINKPNDEEVLKKFKSHFEVLHYNNFQDVTNIVKEKNIDIFYIIKSGENDGMLVPNVKNVVHSVFCGDINQKHGDVYATVSEWLSSLSNHKIPYVPHMINLPKNEDDLRNELGIPKNEVVLGRYGGVETFDIPFVYNSIQEIVNKREDITFIFMNTNRFINHAKVKFLPPSVDMDYKVKFINTCDGMIHARKQGESFGLSVLEFACKNKHIITYGLSPERSHLLYLKNNCSIYNNVNELNTIFDNISKINPFDTCYLNNTFSPENVMKKFKKVFYE